MPLCVSSSNRPQTRRRWLASLLAVLTLTMGLSGCNYVVLLGYLIGGPPSIEPDYDALTGKSMTDKGVVAAVACFAPKEVRFSFSTVDQDVARFVAHRLHSHEIKVIQPDVVQRWIDENPDYDEPEEIGVGVGATHLIYIDLTQFTIYEENTQELYRGRSEAFVTVYEIDKDTGSGEQVYSKELISRFPLAVPRSVQEISRPAFLSQYLTRLSEEIGRLFYEHFNGDDISDAA